MVEIINNDNFQEKVIEASKEKPVIVDFWSPHCGPCLMLGPIMDKLSDDYSTSFIFTKLNVDENIVLAQQYEITGVPTVKVFKDGQPVDEFVGTLPEPLVRDWLDKNIS